MKRSVLFTIIILITSSVYSQEYLKMMEDPNANFYDIQHSFNKYLEGRTPERGQGWMTFKRWEYFMEERTYPTGKLPDPAIPYAEMQKYKRDHPDRINDYGNWTPVGPYSWLTVSYNPGIGRINCVTRHPVDVNKIYAGAPSGGLWISTNGGSNWETATDNFEVLGLSGIVIDPVNPDIIYLATGDGDGGATYSIGILKSTNGGANWSTTGLSYIVSSGVRIYKLVMHPSNNNILIAVGNNGIYRTSNSGANWTQVQTGNFRDIEFNPSNPNIIYSSGNTYVRSTDAGVTFTASGTGLPTSAETNRMAIGVSSANANYVYILASAAANSGFFGFYRSTDQGLTFVQTINSPNILGYAMDGSSTGGQGTYDLAIAVSPANINEIYTGGINIWKSTNGGNSFTISTHWIYPPTSAEYVHADIHSLDFLGSVLYSGCDGGLFKTSNGGTNWFDISAGMSTTQFYRIGGASPKFQYLMGGTQDNGTNLLNGYVWTHVFGADGMEAAVDPTDPNTVYGCYQYGGLLRSYDAGNNFESIKNNITGSAYWVMPYLLDPQQHTTIIAAYQDIWRSTNQGDEWTQISSFGGSSFRSLAVCSSDTKNIYAATANTIYKTTNNGANWIDITAGLPGLSMTYIAVHPTDPNRVWVTFSGYTAGSKIFYSSNAGTNWNNITGTLPNLPANCVTFLGPEFLFIGMDVGVYLKANTGDWESFSTNLPNVIVKELEVHPQSFTLRAATYGRGLWVTSLSELLGIANNQNINPDKFALYQNYPNPFNPSTTISFDIPFRSVVTLKIYDILGKEVRSLVNSEIATGRKSVLWDGKDNSGMQLSSGIYIYELRADAVSAVSSTSFRDSRKLILLK